MKVILVISAAILAISFQNCSKNSAPKNAGEANAASSTDSEIEASKLDLIFSGDGHGESIMGQPGIYQGDDVTVSIPFLQSRAFDEIIWYRNNSQGHFKILGTTTKNTLQLPSVSATDSGEYWVRVTVNNKEFTSNQFPLIVRSVSNELKTLPVITDQPKNITAVLDVDTITLSVVADALPTPTYQWFKNNEPLGGETSAILSLGLAERFHRGNYFVEVTNSEGTLNSRIAKVKVNLPPSIVFQPSDITGKEGVDRATLTVSVTGTAPFTYQWKKNDVAMTGKTTNELNLNLLNESDQAKYSVVVTNATGISVTSREASVKVLQPVRLHDDIGNRRGQPVVQTSIVSFWHPDNPTALKKCKEVNRKYDAAVIRGRAVADSNGWGPYWNLSIERWNGSAYVRQCNGGAQCVSLRKEFMTQIRCFYNSNTWQ